jgi:xanthine/CO dehydrogenase XdhC/CoxF family maturation factor/YHS domain-containing protein
MNNRVLQRAHELMAQGVPFALATVVRRERPTSGQPRDKAIITRTGEFVGWIGGSCAQPTVFQEAETALADGEPRLVVLTPNLDAEGVSREQLALVTCPAGLEISARTLPEVELSIMAEIVSLRRSRAEKDAVTDSSAQVGLPAMAEDPVCHMRVDPQTARHRVDFEGLTYYFCNASCKTSFEKDPRKYLAQEVRA